LPYIEDVSLKKELAGRFNAQLAVIERVGPTEDYVRLQLLIARAEYKEDVDVAYDRIVDVYYYVDEIEDLAIKTACLGHLLAALASMDLTLALESRDRIHSVVENDLNEHINRLL